ncbi:NADH-quinone oxidoreductase subunit NuoE [Georgenia wangjunii]|uniref:NADH-quinone oxidoreductase subunit NuoE n=1 Tax=Georgenia wangjunii TaxID=3117730 RepID=UPI002F26553A
MSVTGYAPDTEARLRAECAEIIARYPEPRSALLPMLHLVQAEDGYVSASGIALCADVLGLSRPEVSAVATFYTQYKRHPNGQYTVGVCTNALCAVLGGDAIFETVSGHLGVGHDETTDDGAITLERIECNAACDYAPVVMVNWEFFDNQTPTSAVDLVRSLRAGEAVAPTRGPSTVGTFKEVSRVLAGFEDGRADEGVAAGESSLAGLRLARENGWRAPDLAAPGPHGAAEPEPDVAGAQTTGGVHSSAARKPTTPADKDPETVVEPGKGPDEGGTRE